VSKEKIENDIDSVLKEVILIFEDYKQKLFSWVDEHQIGFQNLLEQLSKLSQNCSEWGEKRINDIEINDCMKQSQNDTLYF